jgi:hypothetical protein
MDITELNIGVIYKNTMQTIIDVINDIILLYDNPRNYYYKDLINILFKKERQFYIGIIFIILSFVIYFIDGVSL